MQKDLEEMMIGFGDSWTPNKDSVELMEALVRQYIDTICTEAQSVSVSQMRVQLDADCFLHLTRKDPRRFKRLQELLQANRDIKRVRMLDDFGSTENQITPHTAGGATSSK